MNQCINSFFDFCPSDRLAFILVVGLCIWAGYVLGYDRGSKKPTPQKTTKFPEEKTPNK